MLEAYPKREDFTADADAERAIVPIKAVILGARQIRGQLDVPRSRAMPLYVKAPTRERWEEIQANLELIKALANATEVSPIEDEGQLPPTAIQLIDGFVVHAPLASLIDDAEVELARLAKRKAKTRQDLTKCEAKLANQNFVANAPEEIVAQERARIEEFKRQIAELEEQERRVAALKKKP
jgi:valyl-tRNA synthetase